MQADGGSASGGTCHTASAATRSASRLVATTWRPGEPASSRWHRLAQASMRCSQLSRASSRRRVRSASVSVSISGTPGSSATPIAVATRDTTSSACRRSPSSTNQVPSG